MCQDAAQISFHITVTKGSQKKTQRAPLTAAAMKNMDYERGRLISIYHCRRPIQRWRHQTYHHQSAGVAAPASPRGTRTRDIAHAPGFFFPSFWETLCFEIRQPQTLKTAMFRQLGEHWTWRNSRAGLASPPLLRSPDRSLRDPRGTAGCYKGDELVASVQSAQRVM